MTTLLPLADRATPSLPPVERESTRRQVGATAPKSAREAARFRIPPRQTPATESKAGSGSASSESEPLPAASRPEALTARGEPLPTSSSARVAPSAALNHLSSGGDAHPLRATPGDPPASLAHSFTGPFAADAANVAGDEESSGLSPLLQQFVNWIVEQAAREKSDSDEPSLDPAAGALATAVFVVAETTTEATAIAQDASTTKQSTTAIASGDEVAVIDGSLLNEEAAPSALSDVVRSASGGSAPNAESPLPIGVRHAAGRDATPSESLEVIAPIGDAALLSHSVESELEAHNAQNAWNQPTDSALGFGSPQGDDAPDQLVDAATPAPFSEPIADAAISRGPVDDASVKPTRSFDSAGNEEPNSVARPQHGSNQPDSSQVAAASRSSSAEQDGDHDNESNGRPTRGDAALPHQHGRTAIPPPSNAAMSSGIVDASTGNEETATPVVRNRNAASTSGIDGVTAHNVSSGAPGASAAQAPDAIAVPVNDRISIEQAARFADQIAQAIEAARGSDDRLRVRLHPPDLGALQIEVRMRAGELSARLDVQSPEAHRAIVETLPQLRESLGHAGAVVDRIDVRLIEAHGNEPGSDSGQRRHDDQPAEGGASDHREQQNDRQSDSNGRQERQRDGHESSTANASNEVRAGILGRIDVNL